MRSNRFIRNGFLAVTILAIAASLALTLRELGLRDFSGRAVAPIVSFSPKGSVSYRFLSNNSGWLTMFTQDGKTVVTTTADAGNSWQTRLAVTGLSPIPTSEFFSSEQAMLFGQQGESPSIWRTDDGGNHWQFQRLPTNGQRVVLLSSDFLDSQTGWILATRPDVGLGLANLAVIYQTTDGGNHWELLGTVNPGAATFLVELHFATPLSGFISAFTTLGTIPLFATQDGGRTWSLIHLSLPDQAPASVIAFASGPTFFPNHYGLLLTTLARIVAAPCSTPAATSSAGGGSSCEVYQLVGRFAYSTKDAGVTWSAPWPVTSNGTLDLIDLERWVLIDGNHISFTESAGASWSKPSPIPTEQGLRPSRAQFVDTRHGWIELSNAGDVGFAYASGLASTALVTRFALLATKDGGHSWLRGQVPTD
jgi:photosystem II stability/assembly factor-like uncharacterized protein